VPLLRRLTLACVGRANLRPGDSVLDVATGPGVAALAAAEIVGPRGCVTGVDISEKMVALARGRAQARARTWELLGRARSLPKVDFQRRDMQALGAADGSYDALLCAFGLMFAADHRAALAEMARVLAPGGRLSVCVWGRRASCGWAEVFPIVDRHVASDVCPLFFSLGVPGALARGLAGAGFGDAIEERVAVTLGWPSADEACRVMLEGGAVALAYGRFSPEVRGLVRADYLASLQPFRRGERYEVPSEIVFATATRAA
jgi:SAM-dependent methyltransferase